MIIIISVVFPSLFPTTYFSMSSIKHFYQCIVSTTKHSSSSSWFSPPIEQYCFTLLASFFVRCLLCMAFKVLIPDLSFHNCSLCGNLWSHDKVYAVVSQILFTNPSTKPEEFLFLNYGTVGSP